MASKKSARVRSLNGFLNWAAKFDGEYLFRGVSKDTYKIEASACYHMSDDDKRNPVNLCKINEKLIDDAHLLGHYQQTGQQRADLDLLAELQHFGAATCLIDFSRNAQVALWFACQQSPEPPTKPQNGKVFAVRTDDIARFDRVTAEKVRDNKISAFFDVNRETQRYPIYKWQPKYQNNRIIAQQSEFIFGGGDIEEETYCIVQKGGKEGILKSLSTIAGITQESLFPDADNFARMRAWDKLGLASTTRDNLKSGERAFEKQSSDTPPSQVGVSSSKKRSPKTPSSETSLESARQSGGKKK